MRLAGAQGPGGGRLRSGPLVPVLEALPAELVGRADLIREPKRVNPALLFGSPATIPGELEQTRLSATVDDHRADEIRATGPAVYVQAFDRELGVGVQELIDEPDHLDPRDVARHGDGGRLGARGVRDDVSLEGLGRAGVGQQVEVDWHGRNIQTDDRRSDSPAHPMKTKLAAGSALGAETGARQW